MKRFILTIVAVAFAAVLCTTSNIDATPHKGGGPAVHPHVVVHAHAPLVVHAHPAHFHVRGYGGWVSRCWFPSYGCYGYYCGAEQTWYYWYAPFNEYLPISYMSIYPPTPVGAAPIVLIPVAPVTLPMSSALPPGATLVPGPITAP
jgi:hypothetical protein